MYSQVAVAALHDLQEQLARTQQDKVSLRREADKAKETAKEIQKSADKEAKNSQTEVAKLRQLIIELKDALHQAVQDQESAEEQADRARKELAGVHEEFTHYAAKNATLEDTVSMRQHDIRNLEQELSHAETTIRALTSESEELRREAAEAQDAAKRAVTGESAAFMARESAIEEARAAVKAAQAAADEQASEGRRADTAEAEAKASREDAATAQYELARVRTSLDELRAELADVYKRAHMAEVAAASASASAAAPAAALRAAESRMRQEVAVVRALQMRGAHAEAAMEAAACALIRGVESLSRVTEAYETLRPQAHVDEAATRPHKCSPSQPSLASPRAAPRAHSCEPFADIANTLHGRPASVPPRCCPPSPAANALGSTGAQTGAAWQPPEGLQRPHAWRPPPHASTNQPVALHRGSGTADGAGTFPQGPHVSVRCAGAFDRGLHACGQEHRRSASFGALPASASSPSSTDFWTGAGARPGGSASQTPRMTRAAEPLQQDLRADARRSEQDPPPAEALIGRPGSPSFRQLPGGAHETWARGPCHGASWGPEGGAGGDFAGPELGQAAATADARGVPADWRPGVAVGGSCLTAAGAAHEVHAGPAGPAARQDDHYAQGPAADMRHHVSAGTGVGSREGPATAGGCQAAVIAGERQAVGGDGDGVCESGVSAVLRCPGMPAVHMMAPAGLPVHLLPHVMQFSDGPVLCAGVGTGAPGDRSGASGACKPASPTARVASVWIAGDVAGGGADVRPGGQATHGMHDAHMHASAAGASSAGKHVCDSAPPPQPPSSASHPSTVPFPCAAGADVPAGGHAVRHAVRHGGSQPSSSAGSSPGMGGAAAHGGACSAPVPAAAQRDDTAPRDASGTGRGYDNGPAHLHGCHASDQHGHSPPCAVQACAPADDADASAEARRSEASTRDASAGNSGSGTSHAGGSAGDRCSVMSGHGRSQMSVAAQPSGGDCRLTPAARGPAALPQYAVLDTASSEYSGHQTHSAGAPPTSQVKRQPVPGSGYSSGPPAAAGTTKLRECGGPWQQRGTAAYSGTSQQHPPQVPPREPHQCGAIALAEPAREVSFSGVHAVATGGPDDLGPYSTHSMEQQASGLSVDDDRRGTSRGGSTGSTRRCRVGAAVEGERRGGDPGRCDPGGRDSGCQALRLGERAARCDALRPSGGSVNTSGCFEAEFTDDDRGLSVAGTQDSEASRGAWAHPTYKEARQVRPRRSAHPAPHPHHLNPTASSRSKAGAAPAPPTPPPRGGPVAAARPAPAKPPLLIKSTRASRARKHVLNSSDGSMRPAARRRSVDRRSRPSAPGALQSAPGASGRTRETASSRSGSVASSTVEERGVRHTHERPPRATSGGAASADARHAGGLSVERQGRNHEGLEATAQEDDRTTAQLRREVARLDLLHDEVLRKLEASQDPAQRFELQRSLKEVRATLIRTGRSLLARR